VNRTELAHSFVLLTAQEVQCLYHRAERVVGQKKEQCLTIFWDTTNVRVACTSGPLIRIPSVLRLRTATPPSMAPCKRISAFVVH